MLIGIVSDTHDHIDPLRAALSRLRDLGAEHFIHCGDVGGQRVLDQFAGLPLTFVWGNNDWDVSGLAEYAAGLGLACGDRFVRLTLGGRQFAVLHGDDWKLKRQLAMEQKDDYVLSGHTHVFDDLQSGRVRFINPGALYRARPKTAALLNTATDELRKLILD